MPPARPTSVLALVVVASCGFGASTEGTPLDAQRARAILVEHRALLADVKALHALHPEADAAKIETESKRLAAKLGALWIEVEPSDSSRTVKVCFHVHRGPAETYWSLLQWVPPSTVARVQSEGLRLGEEWKDLGEGWFWVWR